MPDRPKSTRPPDWTDHGAFRAAFLERFQPEDRQVLQKAGSILAIQVVSGDVPLPLRNHRAAVALTLAHFNFVKMHSSIRMTPAMKAGVTNRIWSVGDLLAA